MGAATKIVVPGVARLPAFCHAVIAGDFVYVSGMLGAKADSMDLVQGGVGPETRQTLRNIDTILSACDASLDDLIKANVYLHDMADFAAMNEAWLDVIGDDPPARITVGRADLALGAAVEIDSVAYKPRR